MSSARHEPSAVRLRFPDGSPLPRRCCARCAAWLCRPDLSVPLVVGECQKGKPRRPSRRSRWPLTQAAATCDDFAARALVCRG